MKFITTFFVLILVGLLASCSNEPMVKKSTENELDLTMSVPVTGTAYVLLDYTEGQSYDINLGTIIGSVSELQINKVSIQPIRDLGYSKHTDIMLTVPEGDTGNERIEKGRAKKALAKANAKFKQAQEGLNAQYSGTELDKSAIVKPLSDVLAKAGSDDIVFIFSDLIENNYSGTNFRRYDVDDIVFYLDKTMKPNKTTLIAVTEAFRAKDHQYMEVAIEGFRKFCKGKLKFYQTTNL